MSFAEDVERRVKAAYPFIYVTAREENRALQAVEAVAIKLERKFNYWTCTKGWEGKSIGSARSNEGAPTDDPIEALNKLSSIAESGDSTLSTTKTINVLINFHRFLDDPKVIQLVKDILVKAKKKGHVNIFVCNLWKVPSELIDDISVVDFDLPNKEEIGSCLDNIIKQTIKSKKPTPEERDAAIDAALGMTSFEAENAFALSAVEKLAVDFGVIAREKSKAVAKSGILEFYPPLPDGMKSVGGLENLKDWLIERRTAYSRKARDFGLEEPRGILLVGVPGCGKSLVAKAIATDWQISLIRFDMGKLFGSLVGASEENARRAIQTAEAVAPCVLWIDEIEKAMAGMSSSGSLDSGVSARVFGTILSWMQERKRPVFVVATANNVTNLPPELLRAGRFDEVFSVDLPTSEERKVIVAIHLQKRKRKPETFDTNAICKATNGFSGAEIEAVIKKAMYRAFAKNRDLLTEDLLESAAKTVPLSTTKADEIRAIRKWAATRAVPASKQTSGISQELASMLDDKFGRNIQEE